MNELIILGAAGAATWAMRASAIVLVGGRTLPESVLRALVYAKHAVLAALVAAAVAGSEGISLSGGVSPQLLATIVAIGVAWRTGNILLTLAAGVAMATAAAAAGL